MADWVCAKCGENAPAHALSTSTCVWEPVDTDWLAAKGEQIIAYYNDELAWIVKAHCEDYVQKREAFFKAVKRICGSSKTEDANA